jgi:hypothetical protein
MGKLFVSKLLVLTMVMGLISQTGWSQLSITSTGTPFVQNFDGMGTSAGATLPAGFKIGTDWSTGTTATTAAYGTTGAGVVTSSSGGAVVNWANGITGSATDRALGFLNSGSFTSPRSIILKITNNTGSTIGSLNISFDYEKYRSGSRQFDWTFFHGNTATPSTSNTNGDQSYAADANNTTVSNPPTTISKSFTLTGLTIPDGTDYYLKWTFTGLGGSTNGQGIGIDNFSVTAGSAVACTPPTNQPTALNFTPAVTSIDGSFTAAVAGTTPADGYIILINTSNTFTAPTSGTTYSVGNTIGTAKVAAVGSGTTFTASSLTAGTTYFFSIYSYATTNTCYNTTSPLTGTVATNPNPVTEASVAAGVNASEPSTNGTFIVTLTSAAPAGGVTVNYTLTGTATAGSDYSNSSTGNIIIPQGSTTGTITINTLNDNIQEADKTVIVTLDAATAPYTIPVGTSTATITLTDDADLTPISFSGNYSQDFNTLATSGTSSIRPTGWALSETGTSANTTYGASDGTANSGNTYSLGTGTATERAFGALRSGSLVPTLGAVFTNNTGSTLSSVIISYTGEQWRLGTSGRNDRLDFQYSTDATSLTTGTWTTVTGLTFTAPNATGTAGALDGNATGNKTNISFTLPGLSIPNGSNFFIRWNDFDASGADDALGIDDFSMTLGCTPPTNQPTVLLLTPALTSISGSFSAAASGAVNADSYLVVMSTSSSLTSQPSSGTAYAIDDVIGNGSVISNSASTSFTANNLNPSTTYYFFVYSFSAANNCYNITSPLAGSTATSTPPACTPPTVQASSLNITGVTATAADLNYTRGNGDNILIIARPSSAVDASPINGVSYSVGQQIGTGNTVIYNGSASLFNYSSLTGNTTYYLALYEYFTATPCYTAVPLTGSFTTSCSSPVNVTALNGNAGNAQASLTWTNPANTSCYDEVLVVVSPSTISGTGDTYTGTANTVYGGGTQVVFRGTGTNVITTGLTNATTYYFKVFTRMGSQWSNGVQITVTPYDPATGYLYLYGNLHSHSSYSDGNKDNTSKIPLDDYQFARDANCVDFWGISEHNHTSAGLVYSDYALGYQQANQVDGVVSLVTGKSIITLWGMEYGVINNGGHVVIYGFDDQVIGWDIGSYDIYNGEYDYASLWNLVNGKANAFATLAHPGSADYTNLSSTYNQVADNAIVGTAVESGPAFSTSVNYNDFPTSLSYLTYYKTMLSKGYHLGAQMDQDNHNMTFGTANTNRMVVLSTARTRAALVDAIRAIRFYASEDCNVQIDFKSGTNVIGSSTTGSGLPSLSLSVMDPDAGETVSTIELWGGRVGLAVPSAPIKTFAGVSSFAFTSSDLENIQANNTTYYYFTIVTQADGNKIVSSPIWYSRSDVALPVTLIDFKAGYNAAAGTVLLTWLTAQEVNSKEFLVQRSNDGGVTWKEIGKVAASGTSYAQHHYQLPDLNPKTGMNLYRLKQVDIDGRFVYSPVAGVNIGIQGNNYFTAYPNPSTGLVYINSSKTSTEEITITVNDVNGRILKKQNGAASLANPLKVDLLPYGKGTYFIRIVSATSTTTEKVIVY